MLALNYIFLLSAVEFEGLNSLVNTFFKWLINLFPIWSLLAAVVALVWPDAFLSWCSGTMIKIGLGFIMLGMGLTLTLNDFKRVILFPISLLAGVTLQFTVMPLLGWGIGHLMNLPRDIAVGLVIVSCCPGGTASNLIAFLSRANVALSVSMTAVSTIIALVMTPILTQFYVGERVPVDKLAMLQTILIIVILPVIIGMLISRFFDKSIDRINAVSPFVSVLCIILIVGFILAKYQSEIIQNWQMLLGAALILHIGGFTLGYCFSRLFGYMEKSSRTLSIEVGMQNSGLGVELASTHFTMLPLAPVPGAISAVTHCVLGSILAFFWRMKPTEA